MAANALCQPCKNPKFGRRQALLEMPPSAGFCSPHTVKSPKTVPPPNAVPLSPACGTHRRCPQAQPAHRHCLALSSRTRPKWRERKEQKTGKPGVKRTRLRQPHIGIRRAPPKCSPKGTQASHLDPFVPAAHVLPGSPGWDRDPAGISLAPQLCLTPGNRFPALKHAQSWAKKIKS